MFWILWNNARNLLYIKKFNNKKAIRLANNKLETKNFLSERGIPFAKTYATISNRNELYDFDFSYLPNKSFVIKPNQWSKGNGIYITKYLGKNWEHKEINKKKISWFQKTSRTLFSPRYEYSDRTDTYMINEKEISDSIFRRQLLDIIDGKYSMTMGNDKILIEEKLSPWELFKDFCEQWLADIRVIVFNLIPIATMIRVPTKYSNGKANLAQWGLWLGIEVGSGKVTSMLWKNKIYTKKFPKEFEHFFWKKIPYRNDILFLSSKVQYFVNLGYLALDRVITNDGPKLLEINARAGLEVQKVTDTRLAKTLEKIGDLKVNDPEKWVEIAKSLFTEWHSDFLKHNKILYLSQYGKLIIKDKENEEKIDMIVEVNVDKTNNNISTKLYEKIKEKKSDYIINLFENDIILKKLKFTPLNGIPENKIILWRKTAEEFLIKPIHKTFEKINIINPKFLLPEEEQELKRIDLQVDKINRSLNLSARLRPTNYFNELDKFITLHGKYNPIFTYKRPKEEKIIQIEEDLKKLIDKTNKFQSPIKKLFLEKEEELTNRLLLIKAYSKQDFENIKIYNEKLFWWFDEELLKIAKEKVLNRHNKEKPEQSILWKILKPWEMEKIIEKYLSERNIYGVDIVFSYDTMSRISIIMWKEIKISISKSAIFKEEWLRATLAHEIDTHLVRYLNGIKSERKIFKSGSWYYQKDEEWFAIRNANKVLPDEYEKLSMYKKYFLTHDLTKFSFAKSFDYIKFAYPERSIEWLFKTIIRSKKWLINTEIVGCGYLKDKIYLEWFQKVDNRILQGNSPEKMYKGKIKIDDLDFIK